MSRPLLRSVLELRTPVVRLLPTAVRPTAATTPAVARGTARFFNQTAQHVEPSTQPDATPVAEAQQANTSGRVRPQQPQADHTTTNSPISAQPASQQQQAPRPKKLHLRKHQRSLEPSSAPRPPSIPTTPTTPAPLPTGPLSASVRTLLPLLAAQPGGHYIRLHIHNQAFLVTAGDSLRLPFRMPGVVPGDIVHLTRASALGSRDLTLQGAPYVDARLFACRAVVMGTESEPLREKIKKKRRCRRTKTVKSKHRYTVLRISELRVRTEALAEDGGAGAKGEVAEAVSA